MVIVNLPKQNEKLEMIPSIDQVKALSMQALKDLHIERITQTVRWGNFTPTFYFSNGSQAPPDEWWVDGYEEGELIDKDFDFICDWYF